MAYKTPPHVINFRELRTESGLTQQEVAEKLNVALSSVSYWDAGRQPAAGWLPEIAKLFGKSIEELFGLPKPQRK